MQLLQLDRPEDYLNRAVTTLAYPILMLGRTIRPEWLERISSIEKQFEAHQICNRNLGATLQLEFSQLQ